MIVYTLGVYNSSDTEFFRKLTSNKISAFCDVRMRRGVRGAKYSFVNSKKLQDRLQSLSIEYYHFKELAPTNEVRNRQKSEDARFGVAKRQRKELGESFIKAYEYLILSSFHTKEFLDRLAAGGHQRVALFCVEEHPEACHRSLISREIAKRKIEIVHL